MMERRKINETNPNWYSEEEEFIEPTSMSCELGVNQAVICFEDGFYESLLEVFNLKDKEDIDGLPAMLNGKSGKNTAVVKSYFGAPASAMLLEALIASGIEKVLMLGEAGSIAPKCSIGDIILPLWGIREEGTSYHYFPPDHEVSPSDELIDELDESFKDLYIKKGGIWTIDAAFRETKGKINNYSHRGVLAVEMECTALMAVAEYRGIEFASVIVVTDELFSGEWIRDFKGEEVKKSKRLVVDKVKQIFND